MCTLHFVSLPLITYLTLFSIIVCFCSIHIAYAWNCEPRQTRILFFLICFVIDFECGKNADFNSLAFNCYQSIRLYANSCSIASCVICIVFVDVLFCSFNSYWLLLTSRSMWNIHAITDARFLHMMILFAHWFSADCCSYLRERERIKSTKIRYVPIVLCTEFC